MKKLPLLLLPLLSPAVVEATNFTYSGPATGAWQSSADWTITDGTTSATGYPVAGDTATFNQAVALSVTGTASAGTINFSQTTASTTSNGTTTNYGVTLGASVGASTLTMNNGSANSAINQTTTDKAPNVIDDNIQIAGNNALNITDSVSKSLTLAGILTAPTSGATTVNATIVSGDTLQFGSTSSAGSFSDSGNMTINLNGGTAGGSQFSFLGSNIGSTDGITFTGNINLNAGYGSLQSGGALGSGGTFTVGTATTGASFNINAKTTVVKNFVLNGFGNGFSANGTTATVADGALENLTAGNGSITGTVKLGSNANIYLPTGTGLGLTNVVSGAFNLVMGSNSASDTTGVGTLYLSGANTFSGGLTINAGSVLAGPIAGGGAGTANSTAFGTGNVTFGTSNTPTLDVRGNAITTGLLAGSGTNGVVTNSNATAATLNLAGTGSQTYAGAINNGTGTVALTMTSGTQTLAGTSNYTGGTTINGGTLNVTGSIVTSSGVAINNGGTLTGTGTVPALTLNSGGNITPGTAGTTTGMLTASSLTFNGGGTLTYTLSNTSTATGLLTLGTGALTEGTAGTYGINVNGGTVGTTYELASFGSTTFNVADLTDTGSTQGTFSLANDELTFTVTAIPEPTTWWTGMLSALAVLCVWRRRRTA